MPIRLLKKQTYLLLLLLLYSIRDKRKLMNTIQSLYIRELKKNKTYFSYFMSFFFCFDFFFQTIKK